MLVIFVIYFIVISIWVFGGRSCKSRANGIIRIGYIVICMNLLEVFWFRRKFGECDYVGIDYYNCIRLFLCNIVYLVIVGIYYCILGEGRYIRCYV